MLALLKQMENVKVIKKSQLKTIKGAVAIWGFGEEDCSSPSNNKPCSHL